MHIIDYLTQGSQIDVLLIKKGNGACFEAQTMELPVGVCADQHNP